MHEAGMSVPQILQQASTVNGAKVLGRQNTFGSIEKGKLADMILLNANPFESLANWQNIHAIINKGEVLQPVIPVERIPTSKHILPSKLIVNSFARN